MIEIRAQIEKATNALLLITGPLNGVFCVVESTVV